MRHKPVIRHEKMFYSSRHWLAKYQRLISLQFPVTADYNTCTTCVNLKLQIVCYFNERILHVITCLHVYSLSCILL